MAEQVVSVLIRNLGDYLTGEAKLLYGVESRVADLQEELTLMQGFLKEADARQYEDERIRIWVRKIRELAIQAEDVIDTYVFEVSSKTGESKIINILARIFCIVRDGIAVWRVGRKIEDIKGQITKLRKRLKTYGIEGLPESEASSSNQEKWLRRSYSFIIDQDFIGFKKDIDKLVEKLLSDIEDESYHQVVSISGMGGSGKTTLARKVYHHEEVRHNFDGFAWCCVSQQWDKEDVLRQILTGLVPENKKEIAVQRDEQLVKQLFEILLKRKCLVVIDDVWSSEFWKCMKSAIPKQQMLGKILLTTRKKEVALRMDPVGFHHELGQLSVEEGWELLQKKAFPKARGKGRVADGNREELGKEIVEYCGRLPLAIVVIGGILATKHSLGKWKEVHRNIKSCLKGKLKGQDEDEGVLKTLGLSYYDLSHQLKPCFLYLGIFPEDKRIYVNRLYNLWIGEGFLASKDLDDDKTMMDLAEHYLRELAQRCMVQECESDDTGRISSCQLHDLMREFCLSKGREENFIEVIDCRNKTADSATSSSSNNYTRRLAINLNNDGRFFIPEEINTRHLKSIVFFNPSYSYFEDQKETMLDMDLKLLKVLDLEECAKCLELSKDIEKLILLRYLSVSQKHGSLKLLSSVAKLRYLQTLDLRRTNIGLEIPNVLWKMKELRYLYLPSRYHVEEKLKLEGLSNLEMLENFSCQKCNVEDITKLSQLRVLKASENIERLTDINNYPVPLGLNKNRPVQRHDIYDIQNLKYWGQDDLSAFARFIRQLLTCDHLRELGVEGSIGDALLLPPKVALIEGHNFSASLTRLSLCQSQLREDPMPTLERLPSLQFLELQINAFVGEEMGCCTQGGFPRLESLTLGLLDNLKNWRVEKGALPSLLRLTIAYCVKLKMVPSGLKFVTALQQLTIEGMPEEFGRRIRDEDGQEGEDFHIVQHIPSISFEDMLSSDDDASS